jgi:hypothetical protein
LDREDDDGEKRAMIRCDVRTLACGLMSVLLSVTAPCIADETAAGPMTNDRITALLDRMDVEWEGSPGNWRFLFNGTAVTVVTDANADRMRIIAPVAAVTELGGTTLLRLLQANFDSALDARYAIAQGYLWSAFIHPLASLSDRELLGGLGQVLNLVSTFGGSYSSGSIVFGGGDSGDIEERRLIEELINRGLAI